MAQKGNAAAQIGAGESIPGLNPKHASAGFTETIPGMSAAPRARDLAQRKQREYDASGTGFAGVHKEFHELSRVMRVVNRGMKGPMKGQPFLGCADSMLYPDDATGDDRATWLACGEYMDVSKETAFLLFGNLWDPNRPDRYDIIRKYGNHPFERPKDDKIAGQAPMTPADCPPIHDLVVYEINNRGQKIGDYKFVYDIYCRDYRFHEKDLTDLSETVAADDSTLNDVDPRSGEIKEIITAS